MTTYRFLMKKDLEENDPDEEDAEDIEWEEPKSD